MRTSTRSVVAGLGLLFFAGCIGKSEIDNQQNDIEDTTDSSAVDEFLSNVPKLGVADSQDKTEIDCDDVCPSDEQDGDAFCTYTRYTETAQFDEFVSFQPNSATLWPGVVVQGRDAQNGLLTPVGVDLAPVTFSLSLENIGASPVGEMSDPSLSSFREARNEILAQGVTGATAAALDFEIVQVNSESQLSVALGANVSWPGGPDIAASFSFDSSSEKTKILVNFTQAYYTVDVDTPNKPSEFFVDGTTVEDLKPWVDADNPPLYVQSITYGRRVIFSLQSDRSASEVKAALEASYQGVVAEGGVNISAEHREVLEQSTIRAFVLGGSGEEATGAIHGFEGLIEYIESGGSYSQDSPGAPIAYKLAYLDNAVTKLAFTTDYAERTCVKNRGNVRFDLSSIKHVAGGDPGGNVELFGQVVVRYPTPTSRVEDCNTGGELAWLWLMEDGSWISLPEQTTYTPPSAQYIEIENMPIDADQRICVIADMWEEDGSTNELSADDDFGIAGLLLGFDDWAGSHHVVTHGTGDNSVDVGVNVAVE
ncbi:MAG: thiol-activated cytolysin family protein [Polyangiaceae bacterium]|jgi:thiol-activated cytolysin|nr:thiol-activated cytolysin family protein [Polyangiaceae bacterium]MBK8942720.1 thiol-activated cytolysin family protein [Polyangiaceae bacterium]